jgi:hypothetical protein
MEAFTGRLRAGSKVPHSGLYFVTHNPAHARAHEVTCIEGTAFPQCSGCREPYFQLVRAATVVHTHALFSAGDGRGPEWQPSPVPTGPAGVRSNDRNEANWIKERSLMLELVKDIDALLNNSGACLFPRSPIAERTRAVLERVKG